MNKTFEDIIISLEKKDFDFNSMAIDIWHYQKYYNPVYSRFLEISNHANDSITHYSQIPFAPIQLFKHLTIKSEEWDTETLFKSSGTMGGQSSHHVRSLDFYLDNTLNLFENTFGAIGGYEILGLLPNYQMNPHSSLIAMVTHFIRKSSYAGAFYLDRFADLDQHIRANQREGVPTIIFGVSFALLEFSDIYKYDFLENLLVIETGGMKKYRKEMTRQEMHQQIKYSMSGAKVVSEYGMSECLSQLYAIDEGKFDMNAKMKVIITDPTDPHCVLPHGQKGRINIVDLANLSTLSFIATDDIGVIDKNNRLEILGRIDNSDLRGCNYLI